MMRLLSDIKLPGALVIASLAAAIVLLAWPAHIELSQIALFIGSVGAAYIAWMAAQNHKDTQEVKTQVNGNNQRLVEALTSALESKSAQGIQMGWALAQVSAGLPSNQPLPAALQQDAPIVPAQMPTSPVPTPSPPIPAQRGADETMPLPALH